MPKGTISRECSMILLLILPFHNAFNFFQTKTQNMMIHTYIHMIHFPGLKEKTRNILVLNCWQSWLNPSMDVHNTDVADDEYRMDADGGQFGCVTSPFSLSSSHPIPLVKYLTWSARAFHINTVGQNSMCCMNIQRAWIRINIFLMSWGLMDTNGFWMRRAALHTQVFERIAAYLETGKWIS